MEIQDFLDVPLSRGIFSKLHSRLIQWMSEGKWSIERSMLEEHISEREERYMTNLDKQPVILSEDLEIRDLPDVPLSRKDFSKFALTFDPLQEHFSELERTQFEGKIPQSHHSVRVLRAYLYSWQRIWNNKTYEMYASALSDIEKVIGWIRQALK